MQQLTVLQDLVEIKDTHRNSYVFTTKKRKNVYFATRRFHGDERVTQIVAGRDNMLRLHEQIIHFKVRSKSGNKNMQEFMGLNPEYEAVKVTDAIRAIENEKS